MSRLNNSALLALILFSLLLHHVIVCLGARSSKKFAAKSRFYQQESFEGSGNGFDPDDEDLSSVEGSGMPPEDIRHSPAALTTTKTSIISTPTSTIIINDTKTTATSTTATITSTQERKFVQQSISSQRPLPPPTSTPNKPSTAVVVPGTKSPRGEAFGFEMGMVLVISGAVACATVLVIITACVCCCCRRKRRRGDYQQGRLTSTTKQYI